MINPIKITNYDLQNNELEEHILFWVTASGKNGVTSAKCLERFFQTLESYYNKSKVRSPFKLIRKFCEDRPNKLALELKTAGIGCFNNKAITFKQLAFSGLNLKTCSVQDLEKIKGIGKKTSRCFIIHSRKNQRLAGLDVHILRFLRDNGIETPKSTPSGKKYDNLEMEFLKLADKVNKPVSTFDLDIWNHYRNSSEPLRV